MIVSKIEAGDKMKRGGDLLYAVRILRTKRFGTAAALNTLFFTLCLNAYETLAILRNLFPFDDAQQQPAPSIY